MTPFATRREHLVRWLIEQELDAVLVTNPVNVSYLTNFSGDSSYLLVGRQQALLVSDGRFVIQLQEECPGLALHVRPPVQRVTAAAAEVIVKVGCRRVGIDAAHVTLAEMELLRELAPTVEWKAGIGAVEQLRVVKDEHEIAALRSALRMAEQSFAELRRSITRQDTEKSLGDRMEALLRGHGATRASFPTIAAVGPRSALPHCPPSELALGDAELLLLDWGARERFYCSDLTRVMALGTVTAKFAKVYAAVLRAQQAAIAMIRPGVQGQAVDAAARAALEADGLADAFNHGLGHGLGLEVHEAPAIRPGSQATLAPGMVVTVEPGAYLPGWGGIRIEDDVLVTPDGCEVLSSLPRDLEQNLLKL
ncbi:MAG TPA: Xaa-Pro peptidase family protein [Gemmatales bacterium]|nr:Xaa-Pro peptidase family protein [Gemmatales bacterium]